MAKFIYLYHGPALSTVHRTPEEQAERTTAFTTWISNVGTALIDAGSPFGAGTCLRDDGSETGPSDVFGYTIVEAADLAAAKKLADGLPILVDRTGRFSVDIFELLGL